MARREMLGWAGALAVAVALLIVYDAPSWALAFVVAVAVLFVVVELLPEERLKMTRQQILAETTGSGGPWVWLRFLVPMVWLVVAGVQGDGMFIVFGVLAVASLILGLLAFQVFGTH